MDWMVQQANPRYGKRHSSPGLRQVNTGVPLIS
jgi:hypothetical protein